MYILEALIRVLRKSSRIYARLNNQDLFSLRQYQRRIDVFETDTGDLAFTYTVPEDARNSSPGGALALVRTVGEILIAFADNEGYLNVVSSQALTRRYIGTDFSLSWLQFTESGDRLLAYSGDGLVQWSLRREAFIAELERLDEPGLRERGCKVAGRDLTAAEWEEFVGNREWRSTCDFGAEPPSDW